MSDSRAKYEEMMESKPENELLVNQRREDLISKIRTNISLIETNDFKSHETVQMLQNLEKLNEQIKHNEEKNSIRP